MKTNQHEPVIVEPRHLEEGWFVQTDTLQVVSWNIYRNNKASAIEASLRKFIREYDPDVFLLQEAPAYEVTRFADAPLFDGYFKIYEPMHILHEPRPSVNFTSSGQLTLSRFPYAETTVYQLPSLKHRAWLSERRRESVNRVALYTRLTTVSNKHIGLYNVHLENRTFPSGRLRQVDHLLKIIRTREDDVVIVGGDFNTFLSQTFEKCLRPFYEAGFTNLFRDGRPGLLPRLDYFLICGARAVRRVRLRGRGSDHQPIMAEISL